MPNRRSSEIQGTALSKCLQAGLAGVTQSIDKPNCCELWKAKLNTYINWCIIFTKMQQIQEIKLNWFQIRLVHRIIAKNVVLIMYGNWKWHYLLILLTRMIFYWPYILFMSHHSWNSSRYVNTGCSNEILVTLNKIIVLFGHHIYFNQITPLTWLFYKQSSLIINVKLRRL